MVPAIRSLTFLSVSFAGTVHAQSQLDSLIRLLPTLKGAHRVETLGDISWELGMSDAARSAIYAEEALKLAESILDSALIGKAVNDLAIAEQRKGDFQRAIALNRRALRIRMTLGDSAGTAGSLSKLGTLYQEVGRFAEAQESQFGALLIYDAMRDIIHGAQTRGNIARLYELKGDTAKALTVAEEAVMLLRGKDSGYPLAMALGQVSQIQLALHQHDHSMENGEEAMAIFQRIGARAEIATLANNLGVIQHHLKDYERSIAFYQQALQMSEEVGDQNGVAHYAANLGNEMQFVGRSNEAIKLYQRSLTISRQQGYARPQIIALQGLAQALDTIGDLSGALSIQKELIALKDSIYNVEFMHDLSDLQVKYETERTEKDLALSREREASQQAEIQQRRVLQAVLVCGLLLLSLVAFLLISRQRTKHRARLHTELLAERDRGMQAILANTDSERRRIAGELHDGVGQQLTGLKFRLEDIALRMADKFPDEAPRMRELLSIADDAGSEVRSIAHAMMPKALGDLGLIPALGDMIEKALTRPGMHHSFEHFGIDARLPQEIEVGVYRIAQELIGNIIKHAMAKNVSVQLLKNNGHIVLIVEDDGVGFEVSEGGHGIGLQNMKDRAHALHGTIAIANGPIAGTIATLRVRLS